MKENNPRFEKQKEAVKNLIRNLDSENNIQGIFNYCDRWCEKCNFTSRCTSFSLEESSKDFFPDPDAMWDRVSVMLSASFEFLKEEIVKQGFDLEELKNIPEEPIKPESDPENYDLYKIAYDYGLKVHEWFKERNDILTSDAFLTKQFNGIDANEYTDIIGWYHFFISVKAARALGGLGTDDEFDLYDSNGSAKVALIAVERSLASWGGMLHIMPSEEDFIYELIKMLLSVKKHIKIHFPDAEKFVRPGFDEV